MKLHITNATILAMCLLTTIAQGASTGWDLSATSLTDENGDRIKVLYVGPITNASDANCVRTGIDSVTEDSNGNTVISTVNVATYDTNLTSFRIAADKENNQTATITTLNANDNSTITVGNSGWNTNVFSNLTIGNLNVNNGSIIVSDGETLTLKKLNGSLNNVTVYGNLTLSSDIIGLNSFTLDADSQIGGIYNVGTGGLDTVTFTLTDANVVKNALNNGVDYEKQLTGTMWNAEKISSASFIIDGAGYEQGGLVFLNLSDNKYYSKTTWNGGTATFSDEDIITLNNDTAYIVAKIKQNQQYHNITGLYGTVTIPEPTTATLSLLALAGLAARRRRR